MKKIYELNYDAGRYHNKENGLYGGQGEFTGEIYVSASSPIVAESKVIRHFNLKKVEGNLYCKDAGCCGSAYLKIKGFWLGISSPAFWPKTIIID
jgi:hypothetical protein